MKDNQIKKFYEIDGIKFRINFRLSKEDMLVYSSHVHYSQVKSLLEKMGFDDVESAKELLQHALPPEKELQELIELRRNGYPITPDIHFAYNEDRNKFVLVSGYNRLKAIIKYGNDINDEFYFCIYHIKEEELEEMIALLNSQH